MYGRLKNWGLAAGVMCLAATNSFASEPIVQEIDGWKITIRPGASSSPDVPPAPRPASPAPAKSQTGKIQLISLRQDVPELSPQVGGPVPESVVSQSELNDLPTITPGESSYCCESKTIVNPPEGSVDPRYLSQMYSEIYKSIPFIRAEYDANPSYINDNTVEFLFGKMRQTIIQRTTNVNQNYSGGYGGFGVPWAYGGPGFGFGGGYAYPALQLVVPGTGLRVHRLN